MALELKKTTVRFDPTKGRKQREPKSINFSKNVRHASTALSGFHIGYTDEDHEIYQLQIDVDTGGINGNNVNFHVDFLLRDSSGRIDDRFHGWVEVLVIADTY